MDHKKVADFLTIIAVVNFILACIGLYKPDLAMATVSIAIAGITTILVLLIRRRIRKGIE